MAVGFPRAAALRKSPPGRFARPPSLHNDGTAGRVRVVRHFSMQFGALHRRVDAGTGVTRGITGQATISRAPGRQKVEGELRGAAPALRSPPEARFAERGSWKPLRLQSLWRLNDCLV